MERSRWTLLAVCAATFMLLLDISIVMVGLRREFSNSGPAGKAPVRCPLRRVVRGAKAPREGAGGGV